jgi:hypothetical protein
LQPFVHIVSPDRQALQSVPALLQALGQVVIVVTHAALALHIAAEVFTPPLHVCAAPHSVPTDLLVVATQTDDPVEHDVLPFLHGSVGEQVCPVTHETHTPPLQTRSMPHDVPSSTFVPRSMQVWLPVMQVSVPLWHGAVSGLHAPPWVQGTQVPALQTLFMPHDVPSGWFPVSAQTEAPVMHDVAPVRQRLVGWQLVPVVHMTHMPPLQTMFMPQTVPLTSALPLSAQVIVGEQAWNPAWHLFAGTQAVPAVQATQLPPTQTMLVPQLVPSATLADSTQTTAPVLQATLPVRHGLPLTAQVAFTVQAMQLPAGLQTMLVPQLVPAVTFVPLSTHWGPLEQVSAPTWQAFAAGMQEAFSWQATHAPLLQTIPVPHELPFGWLFCSVQTAEPVVQTIVAVRHGLPLTVQLVPAAQATH